MLVEYSRIVHQEFWWPGVMKEVKQYVKGCNQLSEDEEQSRDASGKIKTECNTRKTAAIYISELYFIVTTENITAEKLARLFKNNVWKLHELPESVILDRMPQFVVGLMKKLNEMLGIEIKLFTTFHPQTDRQAKRTNQKLEQYLRMYIDHR